MRILSLFLATFSLFLSACISSTQEPPKGSTPPVESTPLATRPPDSPFPPIPLNETLRFIRYERCTGLAAGIDVPQQWVRDKVPPEFRPLSATPGTYLVVIEALRCPRIALPDRIVEDGSQLILSAIAETTNSSWEPVPGPSFYVFDFFASSPDVAQQFRDWGFPAEDAAFEFSTLPAVPGDSVSWIVRSEGSTISFGYTLAHDPDINDTATNYLWTGTDPFLRATMTQDYVYDDFQYGTIQFEGQSVTAEIVKTSVAAWSGSPLDRDDKLLVVDPELFNGEEA